MDEKHFQKHFLGKTEEEATKTFKEYEKIMKHMANSYSKNTGMDVNDLFSEATFGLARAIRDFDEKKGKNIKALIYRYVTNALNDFVRKNSNETNIPTYIKLTTDNIRKLNKIFERYGYTENTVYTALILGKIDAEMTTEDITNCMVIVGKIQNAANRAGVSFAELIRRATANCQEAQEVYTPKNIIEKIEKLANSEEKEIMEGILEGKTQGEIAKEMKRSRVWVSTKLKKLKEKLKGTDIWEAQKE